jgi:hypothetical protein
MAIMDSELEPDHVAGKDSSGVVFDGTSVTGATAETSATIRVSGYSVSGTDAGRFLVIRGGTTFLIGAYRIVSIDRESNAMTLDRPCADGVGLDLIGIIVQQKGRWHRAVSEYFDPALPNNPSQGEACEKVLAALNRIEPGILQALADRCLRPGLIDPAFTDSHDWPGPSEQLRWEHARDAGRLASMGIVSGNLVPLKNAIAQWATDTPLRRWDLCDNEARPLDWVASTAVETLVYWHGRGGLPKTLEWYTVNLFHHRALDSEDAFRMLDMEESFDAGSGFIRLAPESGTEPVRLSAREQRRTAQEYKFLGQEQGLTRMPKVHARYFKWYALRTFFGRTLAQIRALEFKEGAGTGIGDPRDPDDLSAISRGVKRIADLVGFHR